ncbi:MAG: LytTR family DNA-binding domain-containing protein [Candidatus Ruminococcus intestinipullorum]|nr:LytTR family DNA-binding domain-containing protein [Candidatus Ruminococcus intestinipullorum]
MIQIALVEDDANYVSELKGYLKEYEKERAEKIEVTVFSDGEDIVSEYKGEFDIILMDVEMRFMDGMTAAEKIRELDTEVIIIFITNMPQYAIQGYKVDALDYVLKPVSYFAFTQRIERALSRLPQKKTNFLMIGGRNGVAKLDVSTIYYIEVQNHELIYHTTKGNYSMNGSMKEVEGSLDKNQFFRCHRCYLINLEYVDWFQGSDVQVHSEIIQVSRSRKKAFMDALNNYMNGGQR